MLQRKQTLFLLLAIIVSVICSTLPLGTIEPQGMGTEMSIYSLFVKGDNISYCSWPLFAIMLCTYPVAIMAIAMYKTRKKQAKMCIVAVIINIIWYAYYAMSILTTFSKMGTFHINITALLPALAIGCYLLARKGILDDERLVRSADRIR